MTVKSEIDPNRTYLSRPRLKGKVEFRDVSFSYPGEENRALDEVSFTINPGERVAILGRNGSGKSTIVRQLTGIYQPSEGSVLVDETDIRQINPTDLRSNIGAVLQDVCLFSGTIKENIALGADNISDDDILRAAKVAGVHEFVGASAAGYERQVSERGDGLSGGQRQAIALARALVTRPSMLLMDEPSSALDSQAEAKLISRLGRLTKGRTMLIVTHRLSMIRIVDRVIVLEAGRVVIDGSRDEVMRAMQGVKPAAIKRQPQKLIPTRAA